MLTGSPSTLYRLTCSGRFGRGTLSAFGGAADFRLGFLAGGSASDWLVGGLEGRPRFMGWGSGIGRNFSGSVKNWLSLTSTGASS